jgi:PAS domain S-box-containing protein
MDVIQLGLLFIAIGGLIWLAIRLFAIWLPELRARRLLTAQERHEEREALIIIEKGGRVYHVNQPACDLLGITGREPMMLQLIVSRFAEQDRLLNLFVNDGDGQLSLQGVGIVEVRSHKVSLEGRVFQLIHLARVELIEEFGLQPGTGARSEISHGVMESVLEISESIHRTFELQATVRNILDQFNRFIPSEFTEMTLLDINSNHLRAYRLIGRPGEAKQFQIVDDVYQLDGSDTGFAVHIFETRASILVNNISIHQELQAYRERIVYPFNSVVGVPLFNGDALVGTLCFGMLRTYAFTESNRRLLQAFSHQIGVALANAQSFEWQNQLASEQNIASRFNEVMQDESQGGNLFERLVNGIVDLVQVDMLGFLVYDHDWNTLNAQLPFFGLSEQLVELYQVQIAPQGQVARLVQERKPLVFHQAPLDSNCRALGMDHLARAAGLQDMVLVPLLASGRFLGYLQAAWHRELNDIELERVMRVLQMIVQQATPALENRLLLESSRERANRAESLQKIAALANEATDVAQFQQATLDNMLQLLNGNLILLLKFDKEYSTLRLDICRKRLFEGVINENSIRLPIQDPQFPMTVTARMQATYTHDLHEQLFYEQVDGPQLLPFYLEIFEQLDMRSAIGVPIAIRGNGIGEIWALSNQQHHFRPADSDALETAASHLAGFLDRMSLYAETDFTLRRQVEHLTILRRITNELSTTLDVDVLMQMLHGQTMRITNVNRGTILLYDLKYFFAEHPRVQKFFGETPEERLTEFESQALTAQKPLYLPDLSQSHPAIAEALELAALVFVPIFYQDRPAGMLILKSEKPHHFDDLMLDVMESLAAQAAIAIGNAIQYDRQNRRGVLLRRELATLESLRACFMNTMRAPELGDKLRSIAESLQQATPFKLVAVSLFDHEEELMKRAFVLGDAAQGGDFINQEVHSWQEVETMLSDELQVSRSYYISANRAPVVIEPVHMESLTDMIEDQRDLMAWRQGEIFLHILRDEDNEPLGMVQLELPEDGFRPDQPAMDALELYSAFMQYVLRSDDILLDTQEALRIVQEALAAKETHLVRYRDDYQLLVIQYEQLQTVLESMNRSATLTQRLQFVIDALSEVDEESKAFSVLATEMLSQFDAHSVVVAAYVKGDAHIMATAGFMPEGVNLESVFGQRNPLRDVLLTREITAVADSQQDTSWNDALMLRNFDFRSMAALPIEVRNDYVLAVMLLYQNPDGYLTTADDRTGIRLMMGDIAGRLSSILAMAQMREQVENLNVLIQFSHKLSSVGPQGIVDVLVENIFDYLPAVEGCWVALEDHTQERLTVVSARGYSDVDSLLSIYADLNGESYPAKAFRSGEGLRVDDLDFASAYPMNEEELMRYQRATGGSLPISSVFVPIQLGTRNMGVIVIDNFHESAAFSDDDVQILFSMGQQVALVLENSELYQEALERAEQLQSLSNAVQSVTSAPLQTQQMVERILQQMDEIISAQRVVFLLRQDDSLIPIPHRGQEQQEDLPAFDLADVSDSDRFGFDVMMPHYLPSNDGEHALMTSGLLDDRYQTHVLLPLLARSELLGLLLIEHEKADAYDSSTIQLLQAYASQAAVSLHNAFLFEESARRAQDLNIESDRLGELNEFALQIGGLTNLAQIYDLALLHSARMMDAPVVAIIQVSRFDHLMLVAQQPEYALSFTEELSDIPLLSGLRQSRADYYIPDTEERDDLGVLADNYLDPLGTRSLLIVPMVVSSQFWGWIWVQSPQVDAFDASSMDVARALANHIAISIVNATNFFETRTMRESLEKLVAERTGELERGLAQYEMLNNNLQAILSSMADGVLVVNETGKVVLTNPAAVRVLQLESSLLVGTMLDEIFDQFQSGQLLTWYQNLMRWAADDTSKEFDQAIISQLIERENGQVVFIQGSAVVREGAFLGSVIILRDITAEAMAERLKSEFVTNVSHELRTPITSIKGAVEVVLGKMTGSLNTQQEMFMNMASKNYDRLQVLIDDILEVSQIDAGQMQLQYGMVDMAGLVNASAEEFRARSRRENRPMEIVVDLTQELPPVPADAQRMQQVIQNLVSNAYMYTEDQGTITLRVRQRGDYLQMDISDTGIGIPPEAAGRIFERFYRGGDELVISSAGPGLGLWITRTIVEMHGGEIWFTSSGVPGEGATFSFTLPVRKEEIVYG